MGNKSSKTIYQETLNLPKTEFSMRAGLTQKEPAFLEKWQKEGLYSKLRENSKGKTPYILHDGPPYANGNIHIGHALNKVLKDFIIKLKTMQDYDCLYVPGWDCHGLPIEHQLLKELKKHKSEVDTVDFRKKAHDYAMKYVGIQREQFKRLGIFGEWENPYLTLDPEYEYWILKSLSKLNKKGFIYRGLKPVNWCFSCETALAEAEVEYEDHTSPSIYVKFAVSNVNDCEFIEGNKPVSLVIWTTTPWTLISNVAVAVNPDFKYFLVDVGKEIIILESSLCNSVLIKAGFENFKVIKEVSGADLTKLIYKHPFGLIDKCRVVMANYVTKEDGTGLVHTAPGHGQDDFETGLKNDLDILMPVNNRGVYTDEAGKYKGEHVFKANKKIISELNEKGVLLFSEDIAHSYPHCWRCKNPIIFRATKQWFLNVDHNDLREKLKRVIDKEVKWIPENGKERILGMVSGRPDWCLSRQRSWGVPIPAVECSGCKGEHKLFTEVIDIFADIVKTEGTNSWYLKDIEDFLPKGFKCPDCGKFDFTKQNDILDVWFDSGVSHQAVVKARLKRELPIDLYLEGSDQHRGWFQSSLIPAVALEEKAPYKEILTHGFVVDGQGRKMSKSIGNVISPLDIIKNSGADILRLWVAASSYNEDIRISKEILDRLIDSYRKIRNTFRYLLGNLNGFDPDNDILAFDNLIDIDKWAINRLSKTVEDSVKYYNDFEFAKVYKSIYTFCNEDLSSFYLDILKDRLYTSATKSRERKSAQTVLYNIVNYIVRIISPILNFTAEEVFLAMPKDKSIKDVISVHLLKWLEVPNRWKDSSSVDHFRMLIDIRPHVLKALEDERKNGTIGSSLDAKVIFKTSNKKLLDNLNKNKEILPSFFIVSQIDVKESGDVKEGLDDNFAKTEVVVRKADGRKCDRCWNYYLEENKDSEHQAICNRCSTIVKEFNNAQREDG